MNDIGLRASNVSVVLRQLNQQEAQTVEPLLPPLFPRLVCYHYLRRCLRANQPPWALPFSRATMSLGVSPPARQTPEPPEVALHSHFHSVVTSPDATMEDSLHASPVS